MYRFFLCGILLMSLAVSTSSQAQGPRASLEIDDLFRFKRVAEPQLSPDGKLVVYQVTSVDLAANKSSTALWLASTDGSQPPRALTNPQGKSDRHPRWSPDGTKILFESTRSGDGQLWVIDLHGGEARQVTKIGTGAATGVWSPDGTKIAFVSSVYPEFSSLPFAESQAKNKEKSAAIEANPVKAKVFSKLFFRHWDSYVEDKRQHLFVANSDGSEIRDVTPGDRDAYPTSTTFSVGDDFTFSPDSKHLLFTAVPASKESWSTNHDLCIVAIDQPTTEWKPLTASNLAADNFPKFSPDGSMLAYRAQRVAGYEADRWELMVVKVEKDGSFVGEPRSLTTAVDRSFDEFTWNGNKELIAITEEGGARALYRVSLDANVKPVAGHDRGQFSSLSVVGEKLAYAKATMSAPAELFLSTTEINDQAKAAVTELSFANADLLKRLDLPRPESVEIPVEGGKMQMWILKPPGFDPKKKWPIAYLVHGGPQGAWEDGWSFRWCPQAWAAQGYVVALPNPRGSTGFGQQFVNEISGDWGGKCYRDLMSGADYLEKQPWADSTRIGAAGASFGGYMMNWFAVNTDRFKCLITHCSVWNFESMWGTTDELWFDEYEHGGLPWEKPGKYREFSPHTKAANLGKFATPMLVVHNDLDFRCPIGQGHELFTSLQRQGVPSRFVNFPDEGHWVSKPANSHYWHTEVFSWLKQHVPPGGR